MLVLGAGASQEAGVPTAYDMTKEIAKHFRQRYGVNSQIISFVIGGILFQQGQRGHDPYDGVNIEDLFNAIQLLGERRNLELEPFIGTWHEMVDKFDRITSPQEVNVRDFASRLHSIVRDYSPYHSEHDFERALNNLTNSILTAAKAQQEGTNKGRIFTETNELMLRTLAEIVWIDNSDVVSYLRPILNILRNQDRLVVASLNYDNSMELLADSCGVFCSTGIEGWSKTGSLQFCDKGVSLIKLHGSIDWVRDYEYSTPSSSENSLPRYAIKRFSSDQVKKGIIKNPAVVFGQRNKLTAEGPFLELLRTFKEELFKVNTLTIVGYSFRDSHVNEYLWQWMGLSKENKMTVIDKTFSESNRYQYRHQRELGQLIGQDFIGELRRWCNQRITVIPKPASIGLEELFCMEKQ